MSSYRDLHNDMKWSMAEPPVAALTNLDTPYVSTILDTSTHFVNEFLGLIGTCTDAGFTTAILVEEGDDSALSDAAEVADSDLLGTETGAAFTQASDNKAIKIGYRGSKRYIRVTVTPTGNAAGDIFFAAGWLQACPRSGSQTTQII